MAADIIWTLDNLAALGGRAPQILGAPQLVDTEHGQATAFDGRQDGLIVPTLPLAGAESFTMEMFLCPAPGGECEQRVLHVQEDGSENRALIETRVVDDANWFIDTFICSGSVRQTLYAEASRHPFGPWYHVALVHDGAQIRHYVDGRLEMSADVPFEPFSVGKTSVGVRLNRVSWFRGMIRAVCFTPRVLVPASFVLRA
jgi:hypothetical protein